MEVTAPPPPQRKIEPPFSGSLPQKNTKKTGFLFTRASSKRFQTSSVMKWSSLQTFPKRVMHMQTVFYFLFKFIFLRKNYISEKKIEGHFP